MARTIIFGGSGFIGRHLTMSLLQADRVSDIALADVREPDWSPPPGASFVRCDVRNEITIDPADDIELVVNLAAVHRTPGHEDHEYFDTNVVGAENVTAFTRAAGAQRLWFTSSIAVYGPSEDAKDEHSPLTPVSAYGKSKLEAEVIHRTWAEEAPGRRLVIVRPATVFGPGEGGNFTRLARALSRRAFFYPGRRDTKKACCYVGDLAPSLEFMEQFADPVSIYNFAYPVPPTIEQVCEAFVRVGGLPKPRVTVPAPVLLGVGDALSRVGIAAVRPERIQKLMHSTNIEATALMDAGYRYRFDLSSAMGDWHAQFPRGEFV